MAAVVRGVSTHLLMQVLVSLSAMGCVTFLASTGAVSGDAAIAVIGGVAGIGAASGAVAQQASARQEIRDEVRAAS